MDNKYAHLNFTKRKYPTVKSAFQRKEPDHGPGRTNNPLMDSDAGHLSAGTTTQTPSAQDAIQKIWTG
jgi:hypothetical protein